MKFNLQKKNILALICLVMTLVSITTVGFGATRNAIEDKAFWYDDSKPRPLSAEEQKMLSATWLDENGKPMLRIENNTVIIVGEDMAKKLRVELNTSCPIDGIGYVVRDAGGYTGSLGILLPKRVFATVICVHFDAKELAGGYNILVTRYRWNNNGTLVEDVNQLTRAK